MHPTEYIDISLDGEGGKIRHLRFDNAAIFAAELKLKEIWQEKVSLVWLMQNIGQMGLIDWTIMLWAGLRHEDSGLTLEDVQNLCSTKQLMAGETIQTIVTAWVLAVRGEMPEETEDEQEEAEPDPKPETASGITVHSGRSLLLNSDKEAVSTGEVHQAS